MADTAIAEVQRRATEKLPHFVYPPAKPKLTSGTQTPPSLRTIRKRGDRQREPKPEHASGLTKVKRACLSLFELLTFRQTAPPIGSRR